MISALCIKTYFLSLFRSITELLLHIKQFLKWKIQFFSQSQDATIYSDDFFAIMIQQPLQRAASNCLEVMSLFPSLFFWPSAKADLFRHQNQLYLLLQFTNNT